MKGDFAMKRLVSVLVLAMIVTPSFAATKAARPSYLTSTGNGGYDVTYSYQDKEKSGWYGSLRAELAMLSFKNKYYFEGEYVGKDEYSFHPLLAIDGAVGKRIDYFWRGEVEVGYITEFSDKDEGYEVKMTTPYVMANGYYDFANGLYVGAGLGVAMPKMEFIDDEFKSGNNPKWGVSPMVGLMAGYTHKLDDNLVLDLRYRIAGFMGHDQERTFATGAELDIDGDSVPDDISGMHLKDKIGLILDNSISLGIRYEF